MIMAPTAGRLVEKIHPGILGGIGMSIFATGLFLLATLPAHPADMDIIWRLFICGTGFLLGQTLGATLVAMLFNLVPNHSTQACLYLAGTFAVIAGIVSCLRISQPAPLKRK